MSATQNSAEAPSSAEPGDAPETEKVRGEALAAQVKRLLHEGNVRRITVRNTDGDTIIQIPVTAGVIAAVAAPLLVAVTAIAALASSWQIQIDRAPASEPSTEQPDEPILPAAPPP